MAEVTICLPGVRMLVDRQGCHAAARVLGHLGGLAPSAAMLRSQATLEWEVAFRDISGWRRHRTHIRANVELGGGATIGDGMLLLPRGALRSHAVALALVGQPVTRLVEHPVLDDGMTIDEAVPSEAIQCRFQLSNCRIGLAEALDGLQRNIRP